MNRINENRSVSKSRTSKTAILGLVLVVVGFVLIANQFDVIPFEVRDVLFTWQALLILLGVVFVTTSSDKVTGYILMGIGGFFIIPILFDVPWEYRRLFWPAVFIIVGLLIIFKGASIFRSRRIHSGDSANVIEDVNIFGGGDRIMTSKQFKGGEVVSIFGGGKYDLRQCELAEGEVVIEVVSIFGGSNFILPSEWNVKMEMVGIFGGFSDKRALVQTDEKKTVIIKGVSIFGGGDIKSM